MFIYKTPAILKWLYPELLWSVKTNEKIIYLTFDDGPVPELTAFVLYTLAHYDIKATFFCVGDNLRKFPHMARRILQEGHQLGNHTHNHLNGWKTRTEDYIPNVIRCQQELLSLGHSSALFRPPYGKIKRSQIKQLKNKHRIIMWDVLTGDFSKKISPEQCLYQSIKATTKGAIVVFHDNEKAAMRLKYALPKYIDHFLKKGYQFKLL